MTSRYASVRPPIAVRVKLQDKAGQTRGFSLIELLVVVAIVSILASIGLPLSELAHKRTQEEELRMALRDIRSALDRYRSMVDQGHIARAADDSGYPPSLNTLVDGVTDAQSPHGDKIYFLRSLPRDPFAPQDVPAADTWSTRSYESPPDHPEPGRDVFDVHSKSTQPGLNGIPYNRW